MSRKIKITISDEMLKDANVNFDIDYYSEVVRVIKKKFENSFGDEIIPVVTVKSDDTSKT